jgi:hypothetical protein
MAGFLVPWLHDIGAWIRDVGAVVGLVTGVASVSKAFFEGRPSSYIEPDKVDGFLRLFVENKSQRSIVVKGSRIRPRNRWYIAPNAPNVTGAGRRSRWYGPSEPASADWKSHNVIIAPGQTHEFFLGLVNRDAKPVWCFVLMGWQPSGGLPLPRLPLMFYRSRMQMEHLFNARKGDRDRAV